jgi:hypothetical protein
MTKSEKVKFNAQTKKIEELEKQLKNMTDNKDSYYRQWQTAVEEINSVHAALSTLPGLPDKKYKVSEYETVNLTLTARLFSWIANQAFSQKLKSNIEEK